MNILIYVGSIVGALVVTFGVYSIIRRYAAVYVIVASVGAGIVSGKIIIAKSLGPVYGGLLIGVCGLVAGIIAIPALLISDLEELQEKVAKHLPADED